MLVVSVVGCVVEKVVVVVVGRPVGPKGRCAELLSSFEGSCRWDGQLGLRSLSLLSESRCVCSASLSRGLRLVVGKCVEVRVR